MRLKGKSEKKKPHPTVLYPYTSQVLSSIVYSKCTFCFKSFFSLCRDMLVLHIIFIYNVFENMQKHNINMKM